MNRAQRRPRGAVRTVSVSVGVGVGVRVRVCVRVGSPTPTPTPTLTGIGRSLRRRGACLTLAVGVLGVLAAPRAFAFCRTTTCAALCPGSACLAPGATSDPRCNAPCPPAPPASCLIPRDAQGCLTTGLPIAWKQPCLSYSVVQRGSSKLGLDYDRLLPLVRKGFDLWPQASCGGAPPAIAVTNLPSLTCDDREYNPTGPNANGVYFRDDAWPYPLEPTAIAVTMVTFNGRTGQILDADMELNTFTFGASMSAYDIEYTVGHESGHFFGLDHSPDPDALMYFSYNSNATGDPSLRPDDTAAICAAYPPSASGAALVCDRGPLKDDFQPAQGFARDCGGNVIGGCAVAAPRGARDAGGAAAVSLLLAAAAVVPAALRRARGRSARRRTG